MKKQQIMLYLRGGHTIVIECDSWETAREADGSYSSYSAKGVTKAFSVSLPDLVGWRRL